MSNPAFSVKHLASRSGLPATLTQGRAYFIDDEGSIVINHGEGAVTYADPTLSRANAADLKALHDYWNQEDVYYCRQHFIRTKNLGTAMTQEQYDMIHNGTLDDIYVGDYWENTVTYEMPAYDCGSTYGVYEGGTATTTLRWRIVDIYTVYKYVCVVIYLDNTILFTMPFWDEATKGHGYGGSFLYQNGYTPALNITRMFFPASYLPDSTGALGVAIPGENDELIVLTRDMKTTIRPPYVHEVLGSTHYPKLLTWHTYGSYFRPNVMNGNILRTWLWFQHRYPTNIRGSHLPGISPAQQWCINSTQGGAYAPSLFASQLWQMPSGSHTTLNDERKMGFAPCFEIRSKLIDDMNY